MKLHVLRFPVLDSTNAKARTLAREGAVEGTVVVAESQTAGRGRGDHTWHSPQGGLYYSALLRPAPKRPPTDLPILAGVCLAQTVKESMPKGHDIGLKWPNDCLLSGKKVGGILCEALGEDGQNLCVVGMGLNVNIPAGELTAFRGNPFPATSFAAESGGGMYRLADVVDTLSTKLLELYQLYHREGFAPIRFLWERNCLLVGKRVQIRETVTKPDTAPASVEGTFEGIDDSGALVLSTSGGAQRRFLTGEITCSWL